MVQFGVKLNKRKQNGHDEHVRQNGNGYDCGKSY